MTRSTLSLASLAVLATAFLTGCGPDNLVQGLRNPLASIGTLLWVVLSVMALVDLSKSTRDGTSKFIWALVIIVMPFVGTILYYTIGKKG
ncbi:MAG: PLDc_N domain-containing protein [Rhodothermales bacterium]|nr:PLDc_N domain-containing protein [Rhodothermales bacterium]MCA0270382.1 PLD nuclease N-terminal domain-containing protein [Bacteroidota bacterium]